VPNAPANFCFTFHASQLKRYVENDRELFPGRELTRDGPIVLADGSEEHVIDRILDEKKGKGGGWWYLVRWKGYGPGDDEWLRRREVEETVALGEWLRQREGDGVERGTVKKRRGGRGGV
jgi:hypothetical protein